MRFAIGGASVVDPFANFAAALRLADFIEAVEQHEAAAFFQPALKLRRADAAISFGGPCAQGFAKRQTLIDLAQRQHDRKERSGQPELAAAALVETTNRVIFHERGFAGAGIADEQEQALLSLFKGALQNLLGAERAAVFFFFQPRLAHFAAPGFAQTQRGENFERLHFHVGRGLKAIEADLAILFEHTVEIASFAFVFGLDLNFLLGFQLAAFARFGKSLGLLLQLRLSLALGSDLSRSRRVRGLFCLARNEHGDERHERADHRAQQTGERGMLFEPLREVRACTLRRGVGLCLRVWNFVRQAV